MGEILSSLEASVAIAAYVHDREIAPIQGEAETGAMQTRSAIDLQPFISCGLLTITSLESEAEKVTFLNFAAHLDDGDAVTGAIAANRKWAMATDDRRAIAFLQQHAPVLAIVSTLDMLKHWVDVTSPSARLIRKALQDIRSQARYEPGVSHPLYGWWQKCMRD